ncbi:MAG: preprotein translocase subunit SecE [Planctomycetota bacterium]
MNIINYRQREGLTTRFVTWGLISLLVLFGCISLYYFIPAENTEKIPAQPTFWGNLIYNIPFFDLNITYGTLISVLVFLFIIVLINRFIINKPSMADFLVETEYEVKKVSWPPKNEYWGASVAVIISVVVIGLFIFIVDIVFHKMAQLFLYR